MPFQRISALPLLLPSVLAALSWAALTENRGWWFFLPLWLLLLLWLYFANLTLPALRLRALPAFLLFFSRQLVLGAFDVGRRALALKPQFAPQWQHYPIRLSEPASQRLLASLISLLPGTCSAQIEHHEQQNQLLLHVLDQYDDWHSGVSALEQQLASLLCLEQPVGFSR